MPIRSTEVRIGNWILDVDGNEVQLEIFSNFAFTQTRAIGDSIGGIFEQANGIPLSPSVLEACGFENLHAEHCEQFKKDNILIEIIPDGTIHARLEYEHSLLLTELKSLHHLQNLVHAIHGQELTYNPNSNPINHGN